MKIKKLLAVLLSAVLLCSVFGVPVEAEDIPSTNPNDFEYDIKDDGTVRIGHYNGSDIDITYPSEINGRTVTEIGGKHNTRHDELITNVNIPNTVTTFGRNAFAFYGITQIEIPNNVTRIEDRAFDCCKNLTNITIPDSVTYIGSGAFSSCTSLTTITIPANVTSIENQAFYRCTSLTSITISDSVTRIDWSAFSGCTSLTNITIPNSVTSIGDNAFRSCNSLTSITLPASVTTIEREAFAGCQNLTDVYYGGTEEQWNSIDIGENNGFLKFANIHYNSGSQADTDTSSDTSTDSDTDTSKTTPKLGDVDGDGKVTAKDSMAIQRYTVNLTKFDDNQLLAADTDGDHKVTSKDAMNILRYTVKLNTKYPIGEYV